MNVNIAKAYFDKNGFIFVVTHSQRWANEQIVSIVYYTDFEKAYAHFKSSDNAEFVNLTQAKMRGWK